MRATITKALKTAAPALLLAAAVVAVRWGIALCGLSPEDDWPFWLWPLAAACAFAYGQFLRMEDRRARRLATVYAFFLLAFQILGRQYDFARQEASGITAGGWTDWLQYFGAAALLAPALAWPLGWVLARLKARADIPAESRPGWRWSEKRFFIACVVALMVMWQPYHWAYYPALVEYDSGYQLWQSWNGLYNASNPLFHTFILGRFYLIGEKIATVNAGLAVFAFFQRAFVAGAISYALLTLRRNHAPRTWLILCVIFFGALPVFPMLAISCTKDVPFYSLVLVQMSMIFDGCRNPEKVRTRRYWVGLGLVTLFACLFRANALVAMFAIAPLVCWVCRNRDVRRRLLAVMMSAVALAWGVNALMVALAHADKPLLRESLNVPIIQLARLDHYYEDVHEDLETNHAGLVETPLTYIPYIADLSKWAFTIDGSTLGEFVRLWGKYLFRYPRDYLDAFLLINKGYWYIGDTTYARVYGDAPEQRIGAIPSRVTPDIDTIVEDSRLPWLRDHLERMYSTNDYLKIPFYRLLLCPAFYVWLLLFGLVACLHARRWDVRIVVRHGLVYLAALLLGPCCILRYALLYMLMTPMVFGMLMAPPPAEP